MIRSSNHKRLIYIDNSNCTCDINHKGITALEFNYRYKRVNELCGEYISREKISQYKNAII